MSVVDTPRPTLEALHAEVEAKEKDAEAFQAALGELWRQRQAGSLPLERYPEYLFYEDQLRATLQAVDRLQPALAYARAVDQVTQAKAHYDEYCEPVAAQALRVCQQWTAFLADCAALVHLVDEQVRPLVVLTRADGQPMYELDGGAQTLQNMLGAVPGQVMLAQTVMPRLAGALTVGETRGTHLRRDTVIPQWFQASKAAAASDGHAVHC